MFDQFANLWVCTDISSSSLNAGAYAPFGNNGLYMIPTMGPNRGRAMRSPPLLCGRANRNWLSPRRNHIMSVQHPGETTKDVNNPTVDGLGDT